jgi:hypothetical protein
MDELWSSDTGLARILFRGSQCLGSLVKHRPTPETRAHAAALVADGWPEGEYRQLAGLVFAWRDMSGGVEYWELTSPRADR